MEALIARVKTPAWTRSQVYGALRGHWGIEERHLRRLQAHFEDWPATAWPFLMGEIHAPDARDYEPAAADLEAEEEAAPEPPPPPRVVPEMPPRGKTHCTECGRSGHNRRRCPEVVH